MLLNWWKFFVRNTTSYYFQVVSSALTCSSKQTRSLSLLKKTCMFCPELELILSRRSQSLQACELLLGITQRLRSPTTNVPQTVAIRLVCPWRRFPRCRRQRSAGVRPGRTTAPGGSHGGYCCDLTAPNGHSRLPLVVASSASASRPWKRRRGRGRLRLQWPGIGSSGGGGAAAAAATVAAAPKCPRAIMVAAVVTENGGCHGTAARSLMVAPIAAPPASGRW